MPAIAGSDPVGIQERDPEHRRSSMQSLGLTSPGNCFRTSPRDRSTTARSPSGKRRPPARRHATVPPPPAGRDASHCSRALTGFGGERGRGGRIELEFVGKPSASRF
jgi:hypothetical protein